MVPEDQESGLGYELWEEEDEPEPGSPTFEHALEWEEWEEYRSRGKPSSKQSKPNTTRRKRGKVIAAHKKGAMGSRVPVQQRRGTHYVRHRDLQVS